MYEGMLLGITCSMPIPLYVRWGISSVSGGSASVAHTALFAQRALSLTLTALLALHPDFLLLVPPPILLDTPNHSRYSCTQPNAPIFRFTLVNPLPLAQLPPQRRHYVCRGASQQERFRRQPPRRETAVRNSPRAFPQHTCSHSDSRLRGLSARVRLYVPADLVRFPRKAVKYVPEVSASAFQEARAADRPRPQT
jgi:hypothetical protein